MSRSQIKISQIDPSEGLKTSTEKVYGSQSVEIAELVGLAHVQGAGKSDVFHHRYTVSDKLPTAGGAGDLTEALFTMANNQMAVVKGMFMAVADDMSKSIANTFSGSYLKTAGTITEVGKTTTALGTTGACDASFTLQKNAGETGVEVVIGDDSTKDIFVVLTIEYTIMDIT